MAKKSDGQWLENALDLMAESCGTITDAHGCHSCPLYGSCLDDTKFLDVAFSVSGGSLKEFLELAEELTGYVSPEDADASHWDSMRERDIDMLLEEQDL